MPQKQPPARMARWVVMVFAFELRVLKEKCSPPSERRGGAKRTRAKRERVAAGGCAFAGQKPSLSFPLPLEGEGKSFFKQFTVLAIAFLFQIGDGDEAQRCGVDAVTQPAAIARAVIENVAQMAVAVLRAHFGANHARAGVVFLDHVGGFDRLAEARPAAMALELVERGQQRLAGHDVHVQTGRVVIVEFIVERSFGGRFLGHAILRRRELGQGFGGLAVIGHLASRREKRSEAAILTTWRRSRSASRSSARTRAPASVPVFPPPRPNSRVRWRRRTIGGKRMRRRDVLKGMALGGAAIATVRMLPAVAKPALDGAGA